MNTQEAYNTWAGSYDSVVNRTRDLELLAAKQSLENADFSSVLEIGCGTGKNTSWILEKSSKLLAVDFSEEMMNIAKQKLNSDKLEFRRADITKEWNFGQHSLITCSLVLEHIEDIGFIFDQVSTTLADGGSFYLCELHPYKQLQASRAKFEHEGKLVELEYFIHHVSEFFLAARNCGLTCTDLREWFDGNDKTTTPRLVSFVFVKG